MYSKWLFQSGFLTEALCCAQYSHLSHPPWFDGTTVWWGIPNLELLLCSVLQPSVTSSILSPYFFLSIQYLNILRLDIHEFVHRDTIMKVTNKMPLYRLIYYSKSALHVSGDVFAHHQEHLTVFTVSGSIHQSCCRLVSWMSWNR